VTLSVPPFVHRLGGRQVKDRMDGPYARLCLPYLAASVLIDGTINVASSSLDNLSDPDRLALAAKVSVEDDGNPDVNALAPQKVSVKLSDGRTFEENIACLLGHPDNPMSEAQHRAKFMDSAASAAQPLPVDMADKLYSRLMALQDEADVTIVSNLAAGFDMEKVQV